MINLQNQKKHIFILNLNFEFFCTDYFIIKLNEAGNSLGCLQNSTWAHGSGLKQIFGTFVCRTCLKYIANFEM